MTDELKQAQHFLKIEQELRIEAERKLVEDRECIAQELEALGHHAAASIVRATAPIEPEEVYSPHTVVKDM